jgi:predicted RNA-binding protein with PUA-like domain
MNRWLFKQEPDCYSYDQLLADKETIWDGISNALALKHLREVKVGDRIWFYHTGKEKAIVGEMKISAAPFQDPNESDPKLVVVKVKPVRKLKQPVTLAQIKADVTLADWALVTNSRLSVMPCSEEQWKQVEALSKPGS